MRLTGRISAFIYFFAPFLGWMYEPAVEDELTGCRPRAQQTVDAEISTAVQVTDGP